MNKFFTSVFYLAIAAIFSLFSTQRAVAQAPASVTAGMTAAQALAVKAVRIVNLDKDTYVKTGGFILDRYEERPAYVFNYTDGIVRKIYLYTVFDAATTKKLGLAAYYLNAKTNEVKTFVMPGADGDRKAWDAYIDDLKYVGEKEPGLMSTLTFVLSREMASLLAGGTEKTDDGGAKKKEEYNFCFAADAPVTLADGTIKPISEVKIGDRVKSYDTVRQAVRATDVTRIDTHSRSAEAGTFALTGVWLVPTQELTANMGTAPAPVLLEATTNHPVLVATTESGPRVRKPLGEVQPGELLYRYEAGTDALTASRVVRVEARIRTVPVVYNLVTETGSYLIGNTVVLGK
jgi:Hint module